MGTPTFFRSDNRVREPFHLEPVLSISPEPKTSMSSVDPVECRSDAPEMCVLFFTVDIVAFRTG